MLVPPLVERITIAMTDFEDRPERKMNRSGMSTRVVKTPPAPVAAPCGCRKNLRKYLRLVAPSRSHSSSGLFRKSLRFIDARSTFHLIFPGKPHGQSKRLFDRPADQRIGYNLLDKLCRRQRNLPERTQRTDSAAVDFQTAIWLI